jgi:hypothetical protein
MPDKQYKNHTREEYKKRNNFTDSDYYKIVSFSVKLYEQCAETGRDVLGEDLTEEEINIAKMLIKRMQGELKLHEAEFYKDRNKENQANE